MKEELTFDHIKACFPRGTIIHEMNITVDHSPVNSYYGGGVIQFVDHGTRNLSISGSGLDITKVNSRLKALFSHVQLNRVDGISTFKVFMKLREQDLDKLVEIAREVFESEFIEDFETTEV